MIRLIPLTLVIMSCGCTWFLGDGNDAADSDESSAGASADQGEGGGCQVENPCGGAGTLGYAGGWGRIDGAGFLRLYFSTPAAACGTQFPGACITDCGNYSAYTLEVLVTPEIVGDYDLAALGAIDGDSEFNCSEGEAWDEGGENEVGSGMLEITEVTDSCISGTFTGIAGNASFTVPRC